MKKHFLIAAAFVASSGITMQAKAQDAEAAKQKANNERGITPKSNAKKEMAPASGKEFTANEAKKGITFRWTPVVPKPTNGVTYRLKVWQLMQGQNGTQAMRTNKPIVTKDVADITETTVNDIFTGPCKPPYLCDFIWAIEAIGADGKPLAEKVTTETSSFSIQKS